MDVRDVRLEDSPLGADRVRLAATVVYDAGRDAEEYWFDVSRAHENELSSTGNPWLVCLLPLAATVGEPIRLAHPVDRPLLENAARLMRIWRAWYPAIHEVAIEAPQASAPDSGQRPRAGAFFSGGVDSFFTILRSRDAAAPAERSAIDDLLTVWGFDIPLGKPEAFARLRDRNRVVARALGKTLIDVATNLRATRWSTASWSHLAHGAGLASVALALEKRFHSVYVAGGGGYRGLHPWGSHSVTDPLYSSWQTRIVYDAVAWLRTEKIEHIANHEAVRRALHVCYEGESDRNCGRCNKCLRTMLTLELCGALDGSRTFPRSTLAPADIARIDCSHFADFREFQDIRQLARRTGRTDIVAALDQSARRSRHRRRLRSLLLALRHPVLAARKKLAPRKPLLES